MYSSTSQVETVLYQFQPFDPNVEEDTIFALSSGGGGSAGGATAVSVIRLTGPRAHDALRTLLVKPGQSLADVKMPKARMASLRTLWDPTSSSNASILDCGDGNYNEVGSQKYNPDQLDSALILTFAAPRSFTGEDVVEIHCHGSRAVVRGILDALSHATMATARHHHHRRGALTALNRPTLTVVLFEGTHVFAAQVGHRRYRHMHHTQHRGITLHQRNIDGELTVSLDEFLGSIQRVYQPETGPVLAIGIGDTAGLLRENGNLRGQRLQTGFNNLVRRQVRLGNR